MELANVETVSCLVAREAADAAWAWLDAQPEVESVAQEERADRPDLTLLTAFCADAAAAARLVAHRGALEQCLRAGGWPAGAVCEWRHVAGPREDWATSWRAGWAPRQISERLWLTPAWLARPPAAAGTAAIVRIEPGLGFGTGEHVSTRFCLAAVAERVWPGSRVLDLGTGSGVLAIAAALLGAAPPVVALDHDPFALESARANAEINGVTAQCRFVHADLGDWPGPDRPCDLVLANLYSGLLAQAAPRLADWVVPGGHLALAGIQAAQAPAVKRRFRGGRRWTCRREAAEDGWVGLLYRREGGCSDGG